MVNKNTTKQSSLTIYAIFKHHQAMKGGEGTKERIKSRRKVKPDNTGSQTNY
jgi:hypothetical protein